MGVSATDINNDINKRKNPKSNNKNKSNKKIKKSDNALISLTAENNNTPFQIINLPKVNEKIELLKDLFNQWSVGGFKLSKEPRQSTGKQTTLQKANNILASKTYDNIFVAKGYNDAIYTNLEFGNKIITNKYPNNNTRIDDLDKTNNINEPKTDSEISFIQAITKTLNPKLLQKTDSSDYLSSDLYDDINKYEKNFDKDKKLRVKFYMQNSRLSPCKDTEQTRQRIGIACDEYLQQFMLNLKEQYANHDFRMKVSSPKINFPTFDNKKEDEKAIKFNEIFFNNENMKNFKSNLQALSTDINNVSDEGLGKIVSYNQWAANNDHELINTGMTRYGTDEYDTVSMYKKFDEGKLLEKIKNDFKEIKNIYYS